MRQPTEERRQVPVPFAEQAHRGRQKHRPDERGVEEDRDREAQAQLADDDQARSRSLAQTAVVLEFVTPHGGVIPDEATIVKTLGFRP